MLSLKQQVYLICVIHILFWLYVFFGWLLPNPIFHIQIVLLVALPLAFLTQSLPCHLLVKGKLIRINKERSSFKKSDSPICSTEKFVRDRIADNTGSTREDTQDLMMRLQYCEETFILPRLLNNMKNYFDNFSMMNPFSAQGMVVIGFIINTVAMKIMTGRA